jgi:hypothetical protein
MTTMPSWETTIVLSARKVVLESYLAAVCFREITAVECSKNGVICVQATQGNYHSLEKSKK